MRNLFLLVVSFICLKLEAQKKVSFDLNFRALKSIGKNIPATHESPATLVIYHYNSRDKFINPYFNFLAHIQYNFNSRYAAGLESGIYYHFSEVFSGRKDQSLIAIPVRLTLNHQLFNLKSKPFGIEVAAGGLFFNTNNNWQFKLKNALSYNAVFFYKITEKHTVSLGLEKETDRAWFYYKSTDPAYPDDTYKAHINRVSVIFSYRYTLWEYHNRLSKHH